VQTNPIQALPASINLVQEWLNPPNTQAYYDTATITDEKSFIVLALVFDVQLTTENISMYLEEHVL